jgi:membrane associated rhomboid family serine protease
VSASGDISRSVIAPSRMVFFMWLIYFLEMKYSLNLSVFGILPREPLGMIGVVTSPLIHADVVHLISNTFPLLFLGTALYFFYGSVATRVFAICYLGSGILVWVFARPIFHIGASGLIYGLAAFLITSGIFRKDRKSLFIALVVVLAYGGLVWGLLPSVPGISWESHVAGIIAGGAAAFYYRRVPG